MSNPSEFEKMLNKKLDFSMCYLNDLDSFYGDCMFIIETEAAEKITEFLRSMHHRRGGVFLALNSIGEFENYNWFNGKRMHVDDVIEWAYGCCDYEESEMSLKQFQLKFVREHFS